MNILKEKNPRIYRRLMRYAQDTFHGQTRASRKEEAAFIDGAKWMYFQEDDSCVFVKGLGYDCGTCGEHIIDHEI
jgi:hypothetical protein